MTTRGGRVRSGTAVGRPRDRERDDPAPDPPADAARSAGTWRGSEKVRQDTMRQEIVAAATG
ncbi:hypothetical protein, partial [Actinomyces oris]|uniref:hypothetical protein n=1 Tax=Actinomyces oris TaxID=544580 RepID=UPI00210049B4